MFSLSEMPSKLFSSYATLTGTVMLVQSMGDQLIQLLPNQVRSYVHSKFHHLYTTLFSQPQLTLIIEQYCGYTHNLVYDAAETYLRTKICPSTECLNVSKTPRQKKLTVGIQEGEEIVDLFDDIQINWKLVCTKPQNQNSTMKRYFRLWFNKKFKDKVLDSYLPYVLARSQSIKDEEKVVKLYNRDLSYDDDDNGGGGIWGSINLEHPTTFDKLAMDLELKKAIIDDLDRFVKRKEFYKKIGKAWKRGYLLYGPPGTGKSSLVAAMANYLRFDIYDLELTSVGSNSELRMILASMSNRSILVIEDIDCSLDMENDDELDSSNSKLTLSGLLNFIDGLWSSIGDERIIVFTTNHKDWLDPALLRPGRMDMHIHMSYCTPHGFKILASNYLGIRDNHQLCGEIEDLIKNTKVTPAEVAEELMKGDDPDHVLAGLVEFLKHKKIEGDEIKDKRCGQIEDLIKNTEVTLAEIVKEIIMKSDDPDHVLGGLVEFLEHKKIQGGEFKDEGKKEGMAVGRTKWVTSFARPIIKRVMGRAKWVEIRG